MLADPDLGIAGIWAGLTVWMVLRAVVNHLRTAPHPPRMTVLSASDAAALAEADSSGSGRVVGGLQVGGGGAALGDQVDGDGVGAGGGEQLGADPLVVVVAREAGGPRGRSRVAATRPSVPRPTSTLPTSWSRAPAISGRVAVRAALDEAPGDLDAVAPIVVAASAATARARPGSSHDSRPRLVGGRRRGAATAT